MTLTDDAGAGPLAVIHRLLEATNKHDLESLAECFAPGYVNETPAHPTRGFTGRDTIRSNWEQPPEFRTSRSAWSRTVFPQTRCGRNCTCRVPGATEHPTSRRV